MLVLPPVSVVSELHRDQRPVRPVPRTERRFQSRRRLQRRVSRKHPRISSTSPDAEPVSQERRSVYDDQQRSWVLLPDYERHPHPLLHDILPRRNRGQRALCSNVRLLAGFDADWSDVDGWPRSRHQPCGMCCMKLVTTLQFLPRDACISAAYAVVRCLSVTFVYCVETAKDNGRSCYGMRVGNRSLEPFECYTISNDLE